MAKTADQSQVFLYDLDGETVEVAREHRDAFLRENPKARGVGIYEAGGETVEVADGDLEAFRKANPTAERVHLFDQPDGETVEVARRDVPAYIGSRAAEAQKRQDDAFRASAPAREAARRERARSEAAAPERKPEENRGNAVGRAVSAAGDVLGRVPANLEALGDRIVAGPLLLAGRVADAVNPDPLAGPVDVLTGQRGRFSPQEMGYAEDPYRQGLASRTADKARAWLARRDEARAPKTAAGRVADVPIGFAAQLGGYATPAGPMMMVGNAAAAGDRAYAEGASGAQALGRTAASLAAQAAAFGPKPIPVPGANAAGRAVEGAAARIGGRLAQTPEGAARAVRTAVTAGQVARGAVESGARMAGVTAAEGGDAKDIAIAGAVGGALGGTVRGVATRPLARAAGEAAGRMAGSLPRGGVDTPPPRMDPSGLAANRAAATARTPEGDASLAEANVKMQAGATAPDPLAKLRTAEETAGERAREAQKKWTDAAKRRDFKEAERLWKEYAALDEEYTAARRARIAAEEAPEPPTEPAKEPTPPQLSGQERAGLPAPAEPGAVPTPPLVPAEIPPAVRVPDAVRNYVPPMARDLERREADAARLAEEELATREAPQVAPEEVPPTVAPEVRGGVQTPPPAPEPAPAASVSPGISEWVGEYLARYEQARKRANDVFDPISGRKWGEGLPITEHDEMQRRLEGVVSGMGNDELAAVEKAADANRDAAKKIDDKNAERIWNQVSYHAAATRLMREAATKPTAREPATFPLGMDPRLGRKSIPGFVVPLEGELVPGAEITFQGNAPGKPSVGKIVEDMGKALAVQPESGPQQIVAREEVYGIRAAVPPAELAPAAPVAGSATPPQAEGATPYTIDGAGNVGRRDGKPLTPQDVKAVKKIAKAAGVNLYKDRINGNLRAPGFGLGGSGNPALSAALDGRSAEAPAAPVAEPAAALQVLDGVGPSPELDAVNRRIAQVDAELKAIQDKGGVYWGTPEHRRRSKLQEERSALGVRRARLRAEAPISGESPVAPGLSRGTDVEGRTVYRGEAPAGETARDRMPEQREWIEKAAADALKTAPERYLVGKRKPNGYADAAAMVNWESNEGPKGPVPPRTDIRFDVPGDGSFTVPNEKHAIEEWAKGLKAALNPSGLNAPSPGSGGRASRGLAKVERSAPRTFTTAQAEKLLAPFVPKSDGIRQRQDDAFAFGSREMVAFLRGVPGAKDGKWQTPVGMSKIADFRDGMPVEREGVEANVPELLRDVREAAALVDTSSELLEVPSETKARAAAEARNAEMQRPGTVRLMQGADGRIFVAAEAADGSTVETGDMNGAREIGMFNPEYLEKALSLMAQTGNGKVVVGAGKPNQSGAAPIVLRGEKGNAAVVVMPKTMPRKAAPAEQAAPAPASSRGSARGDLAAETPRLAGTAAGVKPATPDGPRAAIRSELQVLLDSGEKDPATLEDLARRAEAADAFETAALARQAAGTYQGTPWGTEGGSWPAEEPPAARATVGDLVQLVKSMGDGSAPAVMRRIARHPSWAGVFRGEEGVPESGRIGVITRMARLVDDSQKARIREAAARKAAETGEDPATVYASMMARAIRENAAAGPKPLQAVLAHEIGHFLDFLDEGTLKRGNVLGHLAALKKYMARTLFPTKAAADAAGAPGLTAAEVKAAAKEWKVPESEARRRLVEERDLLAHPEIRREMESLVAWFRQTDGAPDYFRNDPAELYAEAFSAWVNYPAETARRAPEFAAALEGWMYARPEAARALEEFRSGITQRAARAAVERGDTTDPAFFAAQEREAEAARWWQRRKAAAAANLRPQTARQRVKAFGDALRVSLTGPLNVIRSDLMASGAGQAFRPENLPLWRAMRQAENAPNLAALWDYRFKAFVEPELEGAPYTAFLNYLKHYRIANELLGKDLDRGRMNLPNPGGVTPGDLTRDGVNQATSSAAWLHALQRDQPELYAKLERARKAFWEKVRNGRDDLGGDGSPMQVVRDTHVLSKEQKEQILGNEGYVSFSEKDLPDPSRRMSSEEQILWDGILSQRTGTFKEPGDVVANTIRGDYNLTRRLGQMELALQTVDWLRANKPWLVGGQAETKRDPATGRLYVEQGTKPGMRTVSFLRDGRPEGWYVPVAYAEAVEMPGRGERSWDGIMGALSKVKRGLNAMQTSWNPVFNTNNSWAKDPHSLALRLPNWRVRGHGLLGGAARALGNVFGHYGEQLASYLDNSGRDYARGKYNPDTARALAWGAVNNAAPGSTAYADAQGGGVGVLEGRLRDRGLEGQTLDDAARRQILKARGLTEAQIDAGLRSAEGTLEKWAKAWDSMGSVARGARLLYPRILSQLQHGEIRTKSYALKRILAERPDLSREEAVEIARQQIGTPDMANKPAIDRSPLLGATLFQYFTPRVHGWVDQLIGAMRRGWTGGTKEQATKFTRLVALTVAMSVPFFILRDAIQTYRHAEEEEGKARARGDLAAAERFAEEKEKARARARSIQAISSRDLFTKVFAFAGDGRALGFSVDPTVTPITTAVLGSLFGREWGVKPGDALREGVGTEILPGFAPLFTAAWGNLRGFDPNTGRPIGGGEGADLLDRLSWTAETLTGRALGTGAFSYARELAAPKDDARSEERRSRQDVPILSAAWRPFWRKTGYGLVERAAAMREEQRQINALVGAIAERYARGQPVSEEDARWFAQHAAQPNESVRAAAERVWKLRNMTPDQRAVDSLSRRSRREIEEKFGYIPPPPRLTDEDRAR